MKNNKSNEDNKSNENNKSNEDNKSNDNPQSNEDNKSNDNPQSNEDNQKNDNPQSNEHNQKNDNKESNNNNEITNFIKKYYRKIVILTHPDKTNDITKNNIFKKAKDNIENKFLIGIIKNCYDLKIEINDLTENLLNHIMFEIRVIQEKIIELRKIINI